MKRRYQRHQPDTAPHPKNKGHDQPGNPHPNGRKIVETVAFIVAFAGLVFSAYSWVHNPLVRIVLIVLGLLCLLAIYLVWGTRFSAFCCGLAALLLIATAVFLLRPPETNDQVSKVNTPDVPKELLPPTPTPELKANEERALLDVKPEYLVGFFAKYNEAQAQKLVETYIGKWVQISGEFFDVSRDAMVTMDPNTSTGFFVLAQFEEQRWVDRVLVLRRGEAITVFGQITRITKLGAAPRV